MLPPFYYKAVSDEGLFRSFAEIIERVADDRLRIYLYHIPPIAQVGISTELIERLVTAYPATVVGVKDSSGDWSNTERMLEASWDNFQVFVGSESFLLQNMRSGGAGCISATANINPAAIHALFESWDDTAADEAQLALNRVREYVMEYPMIPALKATVAAYSEDDAWRRVRPPLVDLSESQSNELKAKLGELGFTMPGIGETA
jgi:4-hydroxy-tetrahydrodipicolinate synthase